jgi:hypothetical protein
MVADNAGTWLFHCHVAEHMMEGMFAPLVVHAKGTPNARAAGPAFFGLPQSQQSLAITRARAVIGEPGAAPASLTLTLEGIVSVYEAFSAYRETVRIRIGNKTMSFQPDTRGNFRGPEIAFRAANANAFGVINGGRMEFEATLQGAGWLTELERLGVRADVSRGSTADIPVEIEIGRARHTAVARVSVARR